MGIKKKIEVISASGYPKSDYRRKASVDIWFYDHMDVSLSLSDALKFSKELIAAIEEAAGAVKDGEVNG
jgi:hypothetical protein